MRFYLASADFKFLSVCRGTLFHGYMVSETLGHTPYVFIKDEDLEYVARSHQLSKKTSYLQ